MTRQGSSDFEEHFTYGEMTPASPDFTSDMSPGFGNRRDMSPGFGNMFTSDMSPSKEAGGSVRVSMGAIMGDDMGAIMGDDGSPLAGGPPVEPRRLSAIARELSDDLSHNGDGGADPARSESSGGKAFE
jgi:hypothetical protein